jgi:hypothetical protein
MATHNDGDACVGDPGISALLIDAEAGDDRQVAVEVARQRDGDIVLRGCTCCAASSASLRETMLTRCSPRVSWSTWSSQVSR